jgi:hypothetical protein
MFSAVYLGTLHINPDSFSLVLSLSLSLSLIFGFILYLGTTLVQVLSNYIEIWYKPSKKFSVNQMRNQ